MGRKAYPSDVSDEERALVAPYLTLMTEDAPQGDFPLREVFNGLRYIVRTGAPWRWMSRFRRLARDYERLPETLAEPHYKAFVILMLKNVAEILA
jgi:transposase